MQAINHALRILNHARTAARDTGETAEVRLEELLIAVDMVVVHLTMPEHGTPDTQPGGQDVQHGEGSPGEPPLPRSVGAMAVN
jgi:hypothetical protein